MRFLNHIRILFLGSILIGFSLAQAQTITSITTPKGKQSIFIPKLDAFWSTVILADNFPTFFPLELEVNLPNKNVSGILVLSPWSTSFSNQTTTTNETSVIVGLGFRYYLKKEGLKAAATGIFLEPQLFYRWFQSSAKTIGQEAIVKTDADMGFFAAAGYQHEFFERLYVQGRLSLGWTNNTTDYLKSYRSGGFMVLPWVGVGIRIN